MRLQIKWKNGIAYAHGTGPDGRRVRRSLKTGDPGRAEEARAHLEATLWRVSLYGAEEVLTFEQCALAYAQDGGDTRFLVPITKQLTGHRLKDITPKKIREAARRAYPTAANATVNRQGITPARAVINYGHDQGWCGAIKVKGLPVARPQRKAVDRAYLTKLRPHLPPNLYALLLFLHTTGRRVGEAIMLKPNHIWAGAAHIPKTKNGDSAIAYLTPEVADLLSAIEPRQGRIFGYCDRRSIYSTLRRACKAANVEYLGTHQIGRHSYATTLHNEGWGSKAIADAGGWKSVRLVAETYEHPTDPAQRARDIFGK